MSERLINENLDTKNLKEFDSIFIKNPTSEDFSWKFNGESYSIKAEETKSFSKFVALHLAKHLSTKMVVGTAEAKMTKKEREDVNNPIHGKITQLSVYDTTERRIALFQILENVDLVTQVMSLYPFKGFIGDMEEYKSFTEQYVGERSSEDKNKGRSDESPK